MRRVMCVRCPQWPIQRLLSERPVDVPDRSALRGQPIILFAESRRGLTVTACSLEAIQQGIRVGMPLGEAKSLFPRTKSRRKVPTPFYFPADPAADRTRLLNLALSCQRYSPLVGLEEVPDPECFWLEMAGVAALFGGEEPLIETIRNDIAGQGFQVRMAIAETWGAAWAFCHFGPQATTIILSGHHQQALAPLPVAALRITDQVVDLLRTLDVLTIEDLVRLPRSALPSRFGKQLLQRLDQAFGLAPELLSPERLLEPLVVEWLFEEPLADRQALESILGVLLDRLLGQLQAQKTGLRELKCHWQGTTAPALCVRLLRPTADRRHLMELLRLQCEKCSFADGVGGIRLELIEMGLPPVRQATLFDDDQDAEQRQRSLADLVDRLNSRLGCESVIRPRLRPDPQPEFACEHVPWLDAKDVASPAAASHLRCRPMRLLRSPRPLRVEAWTGAGMPARVDSSATVRISGPERIETGWWRGPDTRRDYYRLDLADGTSLWAFFDRNTGAWLLHGVFD